MELGIHNALTKSVITVALTVVMHSVAVAEALDKARRAFAAGEYARVVEMLSDAKLQTLPEAQFMLGHLYESGSGVAMDRGTALAWYKRAGDAGHAEAQARVGLAYEVGRGIERDYSQALYWYQRAAAHGHTEAQKNLGVMHEKGHGVSADSVKARYWYQLSAEGGNPKGQRNLARLYLSGEGGEQDLNQAIHWLKAAAEQSDAKAQLLLARLYAESPSQAIEAYFWFLVASETFLDKTLRQQATIQAGNIAARLTSSQITEVRAKVINWLASRKAK